MRVHRSSRLGSLYMQQLWPTPSSVSRLSTQFREYSPECLSCSPETVWFKTLLPQRVPIQRGKGRGNIPGDLSVGHMLSVRSFDEYFRGRGLEIFDGNVFQAKLHAETEGARA